MHADGSARLQTVTKEFDEMFFDLISEFDKMTGIPLVINTSFNIKGEPIVCKPEEAFRCFQSTGIDTLIMGNFVYFS